MKFTTTLIAVSDMERSLKFYRDLFGQEVICDLGRNKTLSCGLTLQFDFDIIAGFPKDKITYGSHNMELYFETEDIDAFAKKCENYPELKYLHKMKTHDWKQRVIRLFDPDLHIIEVGESMQSVAYREFEQGMSIEETAKAIQHPTELVEIWYKNYLSNKE